MDLTPDARDLIADSIILGMVIGLWAFSYCNRCVAEANHERAMNALDRIDRHHESLVLRVAQLHIGSRPAENDPVEDDDDEDEEVTSANFEERIRRISKDIT